MSGWDGWAENLKKQGFAYGGIFGLQGEKWGDFPCTEAGTQIDGANLQKVVKSMKGDFSSDLRVGDKKCVILRGGDGELSAKSTDKCSLVAVQCNQCMVVGVGGQGSEPRALREKLESTVQGLKASGY